MADNGVNCTVISPVPTTRYRHNLCKVKKFHEDITPKGSIVKVYYPRYASFSSKKILNTNTGILSEMSFQRCAIKAARKMEEKFDAVYGHFFLSGGLAAIKIGREKKIPSYIAYGECNYNTEILNHFRELRDDDIEGLRGIIAVSKNSFEILESKEIFKNIPKLIAPNSIDKNLFYHRNKLECRKKIGLPENKFIVGFVGGFIDRKGDKRLLEAINRIDNVYVAFAGKGDLKPKGEKVLFCSALQHDDIPIFLNSLDVFCLPTLNEGSCNAIVEAAACGLPIISSDLPFNDDLLNNKNSIRINPNSIDEIELAIRKLYEDKKYRKEISSKIFEDSKEFTIDKRCKKILKFISEQ